MDWLAEPLKSVELVARATPLGKTSTHGDHGTVPGPLDRTPHLRPKSQRPELYEQLNPMPFEAAAQMEIELAEDLRVQGYTVTGGR